ncbi:hypothetical protein HDV00_012379 [Rhizophlyctis rosea]|nr:hypothetical protein HDV00_012379 [Rhizophlyctis rosea]
MRTKLGADMEVQNQYIEQITGLNEADVEGLASLLAVADVVIGEKEGEKAWGLWHQLQTQPQHQSQPQLRKTLSWANAGNMSFWWGEFKKVGRDKALVAARVTPKCKFPPPSVASTSAQPYKTGNTKSASARAVTFCGDQGSGELIDQGSTKVDMVEHGSTAA